MKRRFLQLIAVTAFALASVCVAVPAAFACTAVYVGSDASVDGTTIMAKSNDHQDVWGNRIDVTEHIDDEPGRTMPIDNDATVFTEIPASTYRYTSTPWMDSTVAYNGLGRDATVCTNEMGVSMLMSITAYSNSAALAADPLVEHGISEFTVVDLVVCQSATARQAVELLCSLIDEYGSSEINIALIADQQEAWYVEMYTGHQYAAVKLPTDAVAAFGNEFSLEYRQDYADCIVSPELETLPDSAGFAVRNDEGKLNLRTTYSGSETMTSYHHMRTWIAHQILAPSLYGAYDRNEIYPLCFKADDKVSLEKVLSIMRNRFEGTEYSPDETGRTDMRVIGTDTAMSVHAVQVYKNLPADISCVTWECTGPAIYGVFVPVSNGATSISEAYNRNQSADDKLVFDADLYPYYRFKELCNLCVEKDSCAIYGAPVRDYWVQAEAGMIAGMSEVLKNASALDDDAARSYITDYCNTMQEQAFDDAGVLLNQVLWEKSKNSTTMKNERDPKTGEVIDEIKAIAPMTVSLDPSAYQAVPSMQQQDATPADGKESSDAALKAAIAVAAVLAIAAVIVVAVAAHKRKNPSRQA